MIRWLLTIGLAVAAPAPLFAAGQGAGAAEPAEISAPSESGGANSEGVLLLRGGGVLQGTITRVGDRYHVTRANGQLDVATDRATLVCRSLEEAYEWQRQQLIRDTAEAHLALAEWCLRYDLAPQAARELTDARRLDPRHPKLALVERRLKAVHRSATSRAQTNEAAKRDRDHAADEMRQLEAAVADLPAGVVERFARRVQPLLVNNCTTAGCHQPSGRQEFQLDRAVLHGLSNRRTTLRNLTATLTLVDRARPQVSPLLVVSRQTHGGMREAVFGPRQADQLSQLVDWVALVTDYEAAETDVAAVIAPSHVRSNSQDRRRGDARETKSDPLTSQSAVRQSSREVEVATLRPKQPLRYGREIMPWQPKDAFDPEIFNRQVRATAECRVEANARVDARPTEP